MGEKQATVPLQTEECPACYVLRMLSPEGDVVCKVCGRDDEAEKEEK